MNGNIARGRWQELRGTVAARWGRMTGDPLREVAGRHLQMVGRLDAACAQAQAAIGRELDGVQRRSVALGRARH